MTRHITLLGATLMLAALAGCGDSPAVNVAANKGTPPKPAPPPSGLPGEPAVKPGTEVASQLGGPQIRALMGKRSSAVVDPGTAQPTSSSPNTSPNPQANPTTVPSAPTTPTTPTTPAADPAANQNNGAASPPSRGPRRGRGPHSADQASPPAGDPSAPTSGAQKPAADPSAPTAGPMAPKADPSAPTNGQNSQQFKPGVGAQGKDYGNADGGYISTPISAFFSAKELIAMNELTRAMRTFEGINNRKPKSQEEFDKEIIQAYQIKLPELHEGEKYRYDPKSGELMVDSPKK